MQDHLPMTKCLLLDEGMLDEDQFDTDPIDWQEDRSYDPDHIEEFCNEIDFHLSMILDPDLPNHFSVLGFCSERLEVTHIRPAAPQGLRFLRPWASWKDTVIHVAQHFGGPDPRRPDVVFEQFERQQRQFLEARDLLKRDIAHLRVDDERDAAKRLEARLEAARPPMLRGFQQPEAFSADPVEQAIDLRTSNFFSGEQLLLEVSFDFSTW